MYLQGLYIKIPDFLDVAYPGQWRLDIHLLTIGEQRRDSLVTLQIYLEVNILI